VLGRLLTIGFAVLVFAALVLKVIGVGGFEDNVDVTALILLAIVIVLGFIALAPGDAREILKRMTSLKVGAIEIGLQATTRVERVESRVALIDSVIEDDDVNAVRRRPTGGSAAEEFDTVRDKLTDRLDFIRKVVLGREQSEKPIETVGRITRNKLLAPDEAQVIRDLLGDAKDEVGLLTADVRERYLDGAWRFASRFATLVFERRVRQVLTRSGWLLFDFRQTRSHRPDFLACHGDVWLMIATRVEPGQTKGTRERLSERPVPWDARRVVVYPDKRRDKAEKVTDTHDNVDLVALSDLAELGSGPTSPSADLEDAAVAVGGEQAEGLDGGGFER
jgi:hypothetical protein